MEQWFTVQQAGPIGGWLGAVVAVSLLPMVRKRFIEIEMLQMQSEDI